MAIHTERNRKERAMADRRARATYHDGKLEFLDPTDLEDGETYDITIHEKRKEEAEARGSIDEFFGIWKELIDPDAFVAHIRERRLINTRPEPKL